MAADGRVATKIAARRIGIRRLPVAGQGGEPRMLQCLIDGRTEQVAAEPRRRRRRAVRCAWLVGRDPSPSGRC